MLLDGFYKVLLGIVWRIEVKIGRDWKGEVEIVNFSIRVVRLERKFLRNFILLNWKAYL